jgi:hypothetical protein
LLVEYGERPLWPLNAPRIRDNEKIGNLSTDIDIVAHIVTCESEDVSVRHMDSNHRYSYGVAQIQQATWNEWSSESGINGDPMESTDAIRMSLWAVQNGKISNWSCAKNLHIIK